MIRFNSSSPYFCTTTVKDKLMYTALTQSANTFLFGSIDKKQHAHILDKLLKKDHICIIGLYRTTINTSI